MFEYYIDIYDKIFAVIGIATFVFGIANLVYPLWCSDFGSKANPFIRFFLLIMFISCLLYSILVPSKNYFIDRYNEKVTIQNEQRRNTGLAEERYMSKN